MTVRLISRSPISAMSLVAMPRALMVVGVLNSYTWANSSGEKYSSAGRPRRVISIYATLTSSASR